MSLSFFQKMTTFKMGLILFLIPSSLASPLPRNPESTDCSCNGHFDDNGEGECKADWPIDSRRFWCYVKSGSCPDAEEWLGNYLSYDACKNYESALIILHGFSGGHGLQCDKIKKGLSLTSSVKVVCPTADRDPEFCLPGWSTLYQLTGFSPRSWYDMCGMPGEGQENKTELEAAVKRVEDEVEKLKNNHGIPSEKIVLAGVSQGGSLALYTALHTKYKLGGVIGLITWLPLLTKEDPTLIKPVENADTPILHINGDIDLIVKERVGQDSGEELAKVFSDYTFLLLEGTHFTALLNSCAGPKVANWLSEKGLLELNSVPSLPPCGLNVVEVVGNMVEEYTDNFYEEAKYFLSYFV